jgi:ATP-binding cassette subfamily B protein
LIENIRFGLISTRLGVISGFANSSAQRIILGLIVFYGGYQIIKGKMTLGSLSAITLYLNQLSGLQSSLAYFFQQVSLGLVSCERLDSILETKLDSIEDKYTREIIFLNGRVEFRNVTFGYRQDKMVLQNLSFSIEGGSCIALVGPSGCGKTTIFNLILRLYKPLSGQIIIDGGNINLIKSKSLYAQIGVVLQEPYLWNDTVANNIKYGKPDASFKEVAEATKIACIDGFINNLPLGYDTIIGENACKISEGQKQRIAIARALIKRPKILILDEAMSSLDSETEDKVIDNIMRGFKDSTIIVVSHRLSAVRKMELIYFLKDASSIETGTHEELLEKTPQYRELFSSQIQALPRPALKERGLSENKILTSTK